MEKGKVIIDFKSYPENYEKEWRGLKPNTIRQIDEEDPRFFALRQGGAGKVRITNTKNGETFTREITDYSEWQGWAIISWRHMD